ncbi:MAG TPA: acyl-CoA dehydrogenase family protein, partial [Xanthobacteraceae bacterium]
MSSLATQKSPRLEVIAMLGDAVAAADALLDDARRAVADRVMVDGRTVLRLLDSEQRATHGLAWLATYVEALRQLADTGQRLADSGSFSETEELLLRIGAGEYLAQMLGGIPMSQGEIVRLSDLGLSAAAVAARVNPAMEHLIATGNTAQRRARLVELMRHHRHDATVGACGLDDTLDSIREEMRKFAEDRIAPYAQEWHLSNDYIPLDVISQMAELGVFRLT